MSTSFKNPYRVEWATFVNGERMPFLVQSDTGLPLEDPTFWVVGARRPSRVQPNTLANELRSLMYLYLWSNLRNIDLRQRVRDGELFSLSEILDLVNVCGRTIDDILSELPHPPTPVVNFKRAKPIVSFGDKRNRLTSIYRFLEFVSASTLSDLRAWPPRWNHYNAVRNHCLELLDGHRRLIVAPKNASLDEREGLAKEAIELLRTVIEPNHPDNPFTSGVQFRNYLIIRLLFELGIRRGELLGIKVPDCRFGSKAMVTVHRRPDDPSDPRRIKPATKTQAKVLPMSEGLAALLHEWITHYRPKIEGARFHPYLIVSSVDGAPMSLDNVNKIFATLREKVPGLPKNLSPHILRHTWNDLFSDLMDEQGVSAEDEIKFRKRLMGWRNEDSAIHYTRRTVRRRSDEYLLKMQDQLRVVIPDDDK